MAPILELQNSVCLYSVQTSQRAQAQQGGVAGIQRVRLVDLLLKGGTNQAPRKGGGMGPTQEPHNSATDIP